MPRGHSRFASQNAPSVHPARFAARATGSLNFSNRFCSAPDKLANRSWQHQTERDSWRSYKQHGPDLPMTFDSRHPSMLRPPKNRLRYMNEESGEDCDNSHYKETRGPAMMSRKAGAQHR